MRRNSGRSLLRTSVLLCALTPLSAAAGATASSALFSRFYGSLGVSYSTNAVSTKHTDGKQSQRSANASIGRHFTPKVRMAVEAASHSSKYATGYDALPGHSHTFKRSAFSLSLNGYRSLWQQGRLTLYAGGGGGFTWSSQTQSFDSGGRLAHWSLKSRKVSANATLGGSYSLTPRLSAHLHYRLSALTGADAKHMQQTFSLSLSAHVFPPG